MLGERLKRARVKAGLSLDKLADLANNIVTKQAISQYEKNQKTPSSTVLIALSQVLDVKVEYFFRQSGVEINQVDFRKHSAFGKKKQEMVKENVREYLERYLQIEDILNLETNFVNHLKEFKINSFDDAEAAAEALRQKWELGVDPITNVVEMLELQDIKVIYLDEDTKFNGLSGLANDDQAHPFIVLNRSDEFSLDRKRFTALHELGHILLSVNAGLNDEKISDKFAGNFLFPTERVYEEFGKKRSSISVAELNHIKAKYRISIAAIIFRLKDLGIINEAMYKRFWIANRSRFIPFDMENILEGAEPISRFDNLLSRAYNEELISISKYAELAGISINNATKKIGEVIS